MKNSPAAQCPWGVNIMKEFGGKSEKVLALVGYRQILIAKIYKNQDQIERDPQTKKRYMKTEMFFSTNENIFDFHVVSEIYVTLITDSSTVVIDKFSQ
jgi:hypothetical protein